MFLCQNDGRVFSADRQVASIIGQSAETLSEKKPDVTLLADRFSCGELVPAFRRFSGSDQSFFRLPAKCGEQRCLLSFRRLNGLESGAMIAVELQFQPGESAESEMMLEIGRATNKLIHDFKNQMGGLKLYAAYLKKLFATQPEHADSLEIADKIAQSINEMTENASIIGKLTRPLELKPKESDIANLIEQVINQLQPKFSERKLRLDYQGFADLPLLQLDSQQMLLALNGLISSSIESSPEAANLKISLQLKSGEVQIAIRDFGESLSEQEQVSFFDFLASQRLNRTSLNLSQAKRIIEAHGGCIAVTNVQPTGKEIVARFKI